MVDGAGSAGAPCLRYVLALGRELQRSRTPTPTSSPCGSGSPSGALGQGRAEASGRPAALLLVPDAVQPRRGSDSSQRSHKEERNTSRADSHRDEQFASRADSGASSQHSAVSFRRQAGPDSQDLGEMSGTLCWSAMDVGELINVAPLHNDGSREATASPAGTPAGRAPQRATSAANPEGGPPLLDVAGPESRHPSGIAAESCSMMLSMTTQSHPFGSPGRGAHPQAPPQIAVSHCECDLPRQGSPAGPSPRCAQQGSARSSAAGRASSSPPSVRDARRRRSMALGFALAAQSSAADLQQAQQEGDIIAAFESSPMAREGAREQVLEHAAELRRAGSLTSPCLDSGEEGVDGGTAMPAAVPQAAASLHRDPAAPTCGTRTVHDEDDDDFDILCRARQPS
eukprot:TRINITY_DN55700_c0_g1_i1.p1 TRINITY_DN55700_c0_g1~~TRINITY_DN55700_c0_g1_i1.p1  ORF type:complete len:399 (+),score=48.30 TRINITY_DN55700_c0_g1_i1:95-1291(+)